MGVLAAKWQWNGLGEAREILEYEWGFRQPFIGNLIGPMGIPEPLDVDESLTKETWNVDGC